MATKASRPRRTAALPPEMREAPAAKRKRAGGGDGVDRLSALPDALLHSVMSYYLPAPQAVQTCALPRRWRDLWRTAPCLDVDSDMFESMPAGAEQPPPLPRALSRRPWEKLKGFTAKLLQSHTAPTLDAFRLRISIAHHEIYQGEDDHSRLLTQQLTQVTDIKDHVVTWILRGASYQPAALEITLRFVPAHVKLPPLGSTASRRLRRLRLSGVLLDGGFADHLRTGCPILKDLELDCCGFLDFQEIVSGTLKSLTIDECFARQPRPDEKWCVRVTAPCLASVTYRRVRRGRWEQIRLSPIPLPQAELAGLEPILITVHCEIMLMLMQP